MANRRTGCERRKFQVGRFWNGFLWGLVVGSMITCLIFAI